MVKVAPIRQRVDVEAYLELQKRFAHVPKHPEQLAAIRRIAERNIERFGLLSEQGEAR